MLPDVEERIDSSHILLDYALSENSGKLQVECQRSTDLFLEILMLAAIGLPFILGGITLLSQTFKGHEHRTLYSIASVFLFLVSVALLARAFALLRDGFRRIVFSREEGKITVAGCSFSRLLGATENFGFNDAAGFRINRFAWRRHFYRAPETVFEIVLVLQSGDQVTVFPYFKTQEKADEVLQRIICYTGISGF